MKRTVLLLLVVIAVFLLSACEYKTNRFKVDLEYERDVSFIIEQFDELVRKDSQTRELLVPCYHMAVLLNLENTKYTVDALFYSVVTDEKDDQFVLTLHACEQDDDKLRCYTQNLENTVEEVEESIQIGLFLDSLENYEIYELLDVITDHYEVPVTAFYKLYIKVVYFENEILHFDDDEGVPSIVLDINETIYSGEHVMDGFYVRYLFMSKYANEDEQNYQIFTEIE